MRKMLIVFTATLLLAAGVFAQDEPTTGMIGKGLKAGIGLSNWTGDDVSGLDTKVGFGGGGFVTFAVSPQFAIQPEALLMMKGTQFDIFGETVKIKLTYIEVPVLFKFMIPTEGNMSPSLFAGPAVGFLMSANASALGESVDIKDELKNIDFGIAFGGGVDFKMESTTIVFDIRYSLGMSTLDDLDDGIDEDFKNTSISAMIGVGF